MKLTVEDIMAAPMFTVWHREPGLCCERKCGWWDLFEGAHISDEVKDKVFTLLGEAFTDIPLLNVQADDDMRFAHDLQVEYDDLNAVVCAYNYGVKLVKLPDEMDSKYYRIYAVGPLPEYWGSVCESG